ncbi:MAG: serine/threonine protein kinase [Candidatus Riflebacteria bacterium]|nr:serine/threonine protein kinase [Candidatus Riflebacteria bacterium]
MPGRGPTEPQNYGPYKITGKLGRGGMASVYKAVHAPDGKVVALKVFLAEQLTSPEFFRRAKREIVALQMCSHPNILKVHGFKLDASGGYLAVDFIDGQNLQELVDKGGKFNQDQLLRISRDVGGALAYCHARGLFHRDIKPGNIMVLRATGKAIILDFGIVKATNMTQISAIGGAIMGTLSYMAPEQFLGKEVDGRTDLYQVGLVLYKLATGEDPPPVSDLVEGVDIPDRPPPLKPIRAVNPSISEGMTTIIGNCIHPDPGQRYPSAHHFLDDIDKVSKGKPVAVVKAERTTKKFKIDPAAKVGKGEQTLKMTKAMRPPSLPPVAPAPEGHRKWVIVAIGLSPLVVLILVALVLYLRR